MSNIFSNKTEPSLNTSSAKNRTQFPFLIILIIAFISIISIFSAIIFFISSGNNLFPTDQTNQPISYHYGETSKQTITFGVNASIIRTKLNYTLAPNSTNYISSDSKCSILVNSGQTPDAYNKTGNDETATAALLKEYLRKATPSAPTDVDFKYISNQGATGFVPMKYSTATLTTNGVIKYAGVYARVISAGSGITVTITTICNAKQQLSAAATAIENKVYFWNEDTFY